MDEGETCKICNQCPSKYCCPRCNILYCSLSCYKSERHGQCSENFYRENVLQEMAAVKDEQEAAQSSRTMMEILKRVEQEGGILNDEGEEEEEEEDDDEDRFEEIDSDDAEDVQDLAERLGGVDLDNADAVWGRLTEEERKEFQGLLESGHIDEILPEVEPWWMKGYEVELIQPVAGKALSKGEKELLEGCPPLKKNIKNFKDLHGKEPSPLTRFNLANILAAYCFTYRYFNGDFEGCTREALNCLLSTCGNLKLNSIYDSEKLAIESVCHECQQEQLPADNETSVLLRQDVKQITTGPVKCGQKYRKHFLLAALSDVHRMFSQVKKVETGEKDSKGEFRSKFNDENVGQLKYLDPVKLKSYQKKVEYMLSYAKDYV